MKNHSELSLRSRIQDGRWLAGQDRFLRKLTLLLAMAVGIHVVVSPLFRTSGDFFLHWKFGSRLLAGDFLYEGGLHVPYPPSWALIHAPLTVFPTNIAMALTAICGLSALCLLVFMVRRVADQFGGITGPARFWVPAGAIFLASRFLVRDLADGGQNIMLLTLSWGGLYLFLKGRPILGSASLGLAVALKCTPLAFVVWFAWKRAWKMAALSLLWAFLFFLSPMLIMGPGGYFEHLGVWAQNISRGMTSQDPTHGVLGEEPLSNQALRASMGRFLVALPEGHAGRLAGWGHADFFDLTPAAANWVIRIFTVVLLAGFGWICRRAFDRNDPSWVWEFATVGILMSILSPIAWEQHFVVFLPAFYLLVKAWAQGQMTSNISKAVFLGIAILIVVTNRGVTGKWFSLLTSSYHLPTAISLTLAGLTLIVGRNQRRLFSKSN